MVGKEKVLWRNWIVTQLLKGGNSYRTRYVVRSDLRALKKRKSVMSWKLYESGHVSHQGRLDASVAKTRIKVKFEERTDIARIQRNECSWWRSPYYYRELCCFNFFFLLLLWMRFLFMLSCVRPLTTKIVLSSPFSQTQVLRDRVVS